MSMFESWLKKETGRPVGNLTDREIARYADKFANYLSDRSPWITHKLPTDGSKVTMISQCQDGNQGIDRGVFKDGVWNFYSCSDEVDYEPFDETFRVVAWCAVDHVPDWCTRKLPSVGEVAE